MTQEDLQKNYQWVRAKITDICANHGRSADDIRFVAVTKGRSAADVAKLHALGQIDFGENFLPELLEKSQKLENMRINWIFIGVLQSNKIKHIVRICSEIQSVASLKHARFIDRYAASYKKTPFPVYLAVNAGKEPQKQGFTIDEVEAAAAQVTTTCSNLVLEGVMAIPPAIYHDRNCRSLPKIYKQLGELKTRYGNKKLSLGMSADLRLAIITGSTCLRVGRSLWQRSIA